MTINRTDTNVLRKQPITRRSYLIPKHSFVVNETHALTDRLQEHIDTATLSNLLIVEISFIFNCSLE